MRKAGQASGRAFTDAMRQTWTKEKELAAFVDYKFRMNGCDGPAYIPVVAGGQVRIVTSQRDSGRLTAFRMAVSSTIHAMTAL